MGPMTIVEQTLTNANVGRFAVGLDEASRTYELTPMVEIVTAMVSPYGAFSQTRA
jgi:hypothetical protein